jgi:anti-sigma B factor antagonist
MANGTFPITIQDNIHVVRLAECILKNMPPEQIGPEIVQIIDKSQDPKLVINFEEVEHLSSASLGMLLMINNSIANRHGQLLLCCLNRRVQDLFDLTKLSMKFTITKTLDEAFSRFA